MPTYFITKKSQYKKFPSGKKLAYIEYYPSGYYEYKVYDFELKQTITHVTRLNSSILTLFNQLSQANTIIVVNDISYIKTSEIRKNISQKLIEVKCCREFNDTVELDFNINYEGVISLYEQTKLKKQTKKKNRRKKENQENKV